MTGNHTKRGSMRVSKIAIVMVVCALAATVVTAQDRSLSPRGQASAQVGGSFDSEGRYSGGEWIDVEYGRPLLLSLIHI